MEMIFLIKFLFFYVSPAEVKFPFQLTDFSLDGWKSSMGLTSDKLTTFVTDQLMEYLGIAGYLKKIQCSIQNGNSTIQGWNDGMA